MGSDLRERGERGAHLEDVPDQLVLREVELHAGSQSLEKEDAFSFAVSKAENERGTKLDTFISVMLHFYSCWLS